MVLPDIYSKNTRGTALPRNNKNISSPAVDTFLGAPKFDKKRQVKKEKKTKFQKDVQEKYIPFSELQESVRSRNLFLTPDDRSSEVSKEDIQYDFPRTTDKLANRSYTEARFLKNRKIEEEIKYDVQDILIEEPEEQHFVSSRDKYHPYSMTEYKEPLGLQEDSNELLKCQDALEKSLKREMEGITKVEQALGKEKETADSLEKVTEREEITKASLEEALKMKDKTKASLKEALKREEKTKASLEEALKMKDKTKASLKEALKKEQRAKTSLDEAMKNKERAITSLEEALEREESLKTSLEEALKREESLKTSLEEALKREESLKTSHEEVLEKERSKAQHIKALEQKEKHALKKTMKKMQAENTDLCVKTDSMKAQVADLKKSQKSLLGAHKKQKCTIADLTAELEERKKLMIKLQNDLEASARQHEKELAERDVVNCAEVKALNERVVKEQEKNLEKDSEIQSLHFNIQTLRMNVDVKDSIVSTLQENVSQQASDLKEERAKNCDLKRDCETAVSQWKKDQEKLDHLIQENRKQASALNQMQLHQKKYQEDGEACRRLEEAIHTEKARFSEACEKIQMQEDKLAEKTLALEKSLAAEKLLRSSLRSEKKHYKQMLLQKQDSADPQTFLRNQLRKVSANSEHLMYDMETLRMENADIRVKFNATETQYRSLSEQYQEMITNKNKTISENQHTIAVLQCMVRRLKVQLEDDVKLERTRNSDLQQRVDDISSALEKERASKVQEQLVESNIKFSHTSDTELMLNQQSLLHLQKQYTELQRQHCDITSDYHELLRSHSALELKYDKIHLLCNLRES
ncbi:golgin subfamily A member 6-like protein 1 [Larimichthys crocea]|uniref:golgin subfamily A member 6-like protein 1 n=1 Tax=Larimichthys crocea TaxID=215358 RepID=UPI000F5EE1C1|nr:golgin subfamily A member 6-like protein 1 [Larimichthys crocea]